MSTTFLPSYSVGPDAYEEIGFVTKFYGKTVSSAYLPDFYKTIQNDFKGDYKKFVEDLFQKSVLSSRPISAALNMGSFPSFFCRI